MEASDPERTGAAGGRIVADHTRILLRPIASPLPLGLLALGCAGVMLSLEQLGSFALSDYKTVALVLLGFVVPLELLSAVLSFLARDTVAATALGLFAGAWLATGLEGLSATPGSTSHALGVFLLILAGSLFVLIAGAAFGKAGPAAVIAVGVARFLVSGLYELVGSTALAHAAAIIGFVLAAAAAYSALATEIEDVQGAIKLPLGRRARARDALAGGFESQLDRLDREAGVRNQL